MSFLNSKPVIPSHELGQSYLEAIVSYLIDNCVGTASIMPKTDILASAIKAYKMGLKSESDVLSAVRYSLKIDTFSIFSEKDILNAYQFAGSTLSSLDDSLE